MLIFFSPASWKFLLYIKPPALLMMTSEKTVLINCQWSSSLVCQICNSRN